jgi:rod shape-determining protein MreD
MQCLWIVVWTYTVFVLHSGYARALSIYGSRPHLVLVGLVLMIVRVNGRRGLLIAAGWGLLLDCLGTERLGMNLIGLTLTAWAVQQIDARWPLSSPWRLGALAALAAGIEFIAASGLWTLSGVPGLEFKRIVAAAAGSAVYSGLCVAVGSFAAALVLHRSRVDEPAATAPRVSNKWRMLTE